MVDRDVFGRRLTIFERTLADLRGVASAPRSVFLEDRALQAQVERWCQVLVEIAIDLAHHLIADRGWDSPTTYRQAFEILARHEVLPAQLATQIASWAGLRNILVHLYLDVDHDLLYSIVTTELDQMEAFARAMSRAAFD